MKRYEEYTTIDSRWANYIPASWTFSKIAEVFIERKETNDPIKTTDILSLTNTRGVIPYKEKGSIGNKAKEDLTGYRLAYPGDIVFNSMNAVIGSVGLSKYFGAVSPVYYMLYLRDTVKNSVRYFDYVFQDKVFQNGLNGLGNGILEIRMRIPMSKLKYVGVPVPPRAEQDQIVRYLDWQVSKINRLIAAKREKIALFEELKTHQTTDAVLHGVKQYKKYIETQEFGRIPAHWQIYQNKRLFRERVEHSKMGAETLLSVSKHYGVKPSADLTEDEQFATIKPALSLTGYKVVHKNDLVMNIMRARNGSYGISAYNGIVSPAYCIYYVTKNCNVKYLHYFLRTPHVKSLFETYSSGIAEHRRRLYPEDFLRLASVLPPIEDQNEIVEYIGQSLVKYDEAIANLKRQIACLQDMKTRLISDVVTGQVDVRDIKVPDGEYTYTETLEEETEEEPVADGEE